MTTDEEKKGNTFTLLSFFLSVFFQAVVVLSILSLLANLFRANLTPFMALVLDQWEVLSHALTELLGIRVDTWTGILFVALVILTLACATLFIWLRSLFWRRLAKRKEGPDSDLEGSRSKERSSSILAALGSAFLDAIARYIAAPLLTCMVTLSLTWNLLFGVYSTLGLNYAIASASLVVFTTCLLLAAGLQRFIPGN